MAQGSYERTPEVRAKQRQAMLGKTMSPETREKIRQSMLGTHYNLGKTRSPEVRENLRQIHLARYEKPGAREKHAQAMRRPEVRAKLRQATLKQWEDPAFREIRLQSRLRQHFPVKMTTIERLLRDEFRKRRLKFEMHKVMFGRFQPDFVFEQARLIVQADGDYWHGPNSPNKKRDQAFNGMASAEGWSVWRFGETEIHMHAPACARAVARFVRDHGLKFARVTCVSVPPILPRTRSSSTPPLE